jgi:hypothetical protein
LDSLVKYAPGKQVILQFNNKPDVSAARAKLLVRDGLSHALRFMALAGLRRAMILAPGSTARAGVRGTEQPA